MLTPRLECRSRGAAHRPTPRRATPNAPRRACAALALALVALLLPARASALQDQSAASVESATTLIVVRPPALFRVPGVAPLATAALQPHVATLEPFGVEVPESVDALYAATWADAQFSVLGVGRWNGAAIRDALGARDGLEVRGGLVFGSERLVFDISDTAWLAYDRSPHATWVEDCRRAAGDDALFVRVRPAPALRQAHPSVARLTELRVRIIAPDSGESAALTVEAELGNAGAEGAAANDGRVELERALREAARIPEVGALGVSAFLDAGSTETHGATIRWSVPLDGPAWDALLDAITELMNEELR